MTAGFTGRARGRDLASGGVRLAVQVGDETFEVEHPLPPALPRPPFRARIGARIRAAWLRWRGRLTTDPQRRWSFTLQRHLLYRRQRSNAFRRLHTDALLKDFAAAVLEATVVQIGANDGFTGDPIRALLAGRGQRWRGVLVEPVAHLHARLGELYRENARLRVERAAIGETDGTVEIHRLRTGPAESLWLEQLASLDEAVLRESARQFGVKNLEVISERVPAITVATLLQRHHITSLDLLIIDTEGWDWRILRQFDLATLGPKLILFEHQHLRSEERVEAHHFLRQHRYDWAETPEGDTLAWQECASR
nr:FkbM family methyltransferase [Chthoniobacterales bacterium]